MSRRRRTLPFVIFMILLTACGGTALAFGGFAWLSSRAAALYGPPSSNLDALDRITISAQLVLSAPQLTTTVDPDGSAAEFDVGQGESVGSIAYRLEAEDLIADGNAFRLYLVYSGIDTRIQAGQYQLSGAMTPLQIAAQLQDATPADVDFGVLAGWRLEEIAAALPTSGLSFGSDEFLSLASLHPGGYSFSPLLPESATLEGFFLPGSYSIPRETTLQEFIHTFLEQFEQQVTQELRDRFSDQGLDLYQAVTLASIVQREAVIEQEQPMIASVFYNRLAAGMKLDSDPTVQYAVGYNLLQGTWWTNPISATDLQIDSPYNTYIYAGLPPGPIANPGLSALHAVAFPAQTPYYYFRAACDGSRLHRFAETYQQHLENGCP